MSASPSNMPSVDAAQIHPDFGYLAPTMRFRRKFALTLKAAVFGALAGAVAMFFVAIGHEDKPTLTMLASPVLIAPPSSAQAQAPAATTPAVPARAPVVATPAASTSAPARPTWVATDVIAPPVRFLSESMALPAAASRDLGLRGSTPTVATTVPGPVPQPAAAKTVAKPKTKIVREPPPDPEPRAAFAGPPRLLGLPIFGFGWQ